MRKAQDGLSWLYSSDESQKPCMIELTAKYGMEGYGRWMILCEELFKQPDRKLPLIQEVYENLAELMDCTNKYAEDFIRDCIDDLEVLEADDEFFWRKRGFIFP